MALSYYRIISFDGIVGSGVTDSQYAKISAVVKSTHDDAPYCLCNELICAELGRYVRLPIPPFAIIHAKNQNPELWFASLNFNFTGIAPPPVDPDICFTKLAYEATGLLLFDILIANGDRHSKNIALDLGSIPPRLSIFDHSHALLGSDKGKGIERLRALDGRLGITGESPTYGNRHCLLDSVSSDTHFQQWIERIRSIPDFVIDESCDEAVSVGANQEEINEAKKFLKSRRDGLRQIIRNHEDQFTGISQWSLPL